MRRLRSEATKPTETRVSVGEYGEQRREPSRATGVTALAVSSRRVLTVKARDFAELAVGAKGGKVCDGAIIRCFPPEGATDEQIAKVDAALRAAGAVVVRMMPVPRTATVTADAKAEAATAPGEARTIRQVVAELVARASTSNRARLAEAVEAALAAEGL